MNATRTEIIAYFASDVNGKGLDRDYLDTCPDQRLRRMAELAGRGFSSWLAVQRRPAPAAREGEGGQDGG